MLVTTREQDGDAVVRVAGPVGPLDGGDLRDALLEAATSQPGTVMCDLRHAVAEPDGLTVLLAVADQFQEWPGCSLAVLAVDPVLRTALTTAGVTPRVPVAGSVAEAREALRSVRRPVRAVLRLVPGVRAPGRAREFLADAVRDAQATEATDGVDLDAAALVLTELVTNAVLHAGTRLEVLVSVRPGRLGIAVGDEDGAAPSAAHSATGDATGDETGRGLTLVDALTVSWGVVARGAGKVVWAVLGPGATPVPPAAPPVPSGAGT